MALPVLLRKLFKSSGAGSELNDSIVSKTISNQDWSNSYNYPVGAIARGSNGVLYYSVAQSGPGTSAGAKNPTSNDGTYWRSIDIASLSTAIATLNSNLNSGLATKVSLDGSNTASISSALGAYMAHASMPDLASPISISIPSNTNGGDTAAMPYDGYLCYRARCSAGKTVSPLLIAYMPPADANGIYIAGTSFTNIQGWEVAVILPVLKGYVVRLHLDVSTADSYEKRLYLFPCIKR